jgi:hypothetical protein
MRVPKWLRVMLLSALFLLVLSAGGLWAFVYGVLGRGPEARCAGHHHFAPALWHDTTKAFGPLAVRGCMVDDLLARRRFRAQSRADIVALLGEPRPTEYFREYDLVYWLGPERGPFSIDSEWLVFRLDPQGRVTEYRLVTD